MSNKTYLTEHPELIKRSTTASNVSKYNYESKISVQQVAAALINQQRQLIRELTLKIQVYEVKIDDERNKELDFSPQIEDCEHQVEQLKKQQVIINQQIVNCQLVENQVTPMEYYLWKKKQRINTYDASIAELCRDTERQRQEYEKSSEQYRHESDELQGQIEELEERIANFNASPRDSLFEEDAKQDQFDELFSRNITLKEEYSGLVGINESLQQNKDIVGMQVIDNIESIQSTLRSFFDSEKTKLAKEFKQLQQEARNAEISPLSNDQQSYKIDPLCNDYSYKLRELYSAAPEEIRKIIYPILQPLPWDKFNWREFIEADLRSEQVYNTYTELEAQYMRNEVETEKLQAELRKLNQQIMGQQQKCNEIAINIVKLRKKLDK